MSGSGTGTPAVAAAEDVTLQAIERAIACRVGPFLWVEATGSTVNDVTVATLQSSMNLGGWEGLYLLRRGYKSNGDPVVGFDPIDRQRLVKTYEPSTGTLTPDRGWQMAPATEEVLELHLLDPEHELRHAARQGLQRCFFDDRVQVTLTAMSAERNLTAVAPWITSTRQVLEVEFVTTNQALYLPAAVHWWQPFMKAGVVWLKGSPDPFPNTLLVTARRTHFSWVNGVDSSGGPTLDNDVLAMELAYAASAGHIEAWRCARQRLYPVSQTGITHTMEQAAADFTRVSADHYQSEYPSRMNQLRFQHPTDGRTRWGHTVVNG